MIEDSITTWKPLRGIGHALLVRGKLDNLEMDVVVWCPYDSLRGVSPFTYQALFLGFIRCGTDLRPYRPERVLRQFGHV